MKKVLACFAAVVILLGFCGVVWGEVRLCKVFSDGMVLQRNIDLKVWGWANKGEQVKVSFCGRSEKATAGDDGRWEITLGRFEAGGPFEMVLEGDNRVEIKDVLIGEVWICSGQSNMEMIVEGAMNSRAEVEAANFEQMRFFTVARNASSRPLDDVRGYWRSCTGENVAACSAAAYFFGRRIHQELDVPVGLICSSWGGTRIEPWTPMAGFEQVPKLASLIKHINKDKAEYNEQLRSIVDEVEVWVRKMKQAGADEKMPQPPAWPAHPLASERAPMSLYNGMIHPLVGYGIRGALWYQGEANNDGDGMYNKLMEALIAGWRQVWGQGDFGFYYVQLAPYRYSRPERWLPMIWQAQMETLSVPNTGMAVTVDLVDDINNIHPKNKQDVGKRLALWALAKDYGKDDIVYSGPIYDGISVAGSEIRVSFKYTGSGLATRDGKAPSHFQVAGKDRKFVTADAKIDGDTVVVSSKEVPQPVAVRFGWHQEAQPNLMNKEGLPASPFRSDDWFIRP